MSEKLTDERPKAEPDKDSSEQGRMPDRSASKPAEEGVDQLAKKLEQTKIDDTTEKSASSTAKEGEAAADSPAAKSDGKGTDSPARSPDEKSGPEENQVIAELTPAQRLVLEELKGYQEEHAKIEEDYEKELLVLQAKYIKLYTPLYEKRAVTLSKPPAEPVSDPRGTACLPDFWLEAMKNCRNIANMIQKKDEPILSYVTNLRMEWLDIDEQLGFKIIFHFSENPYFSNKELSKTFHLQRSPDTGAPLVLGDKILTDTDGTIIDWYAGKDVTVEEIQKTQRHKRTKEKRTITQTVPADTFFNFFKKRQIPNEDQIHKMDRKEFDELETEVENDVEVGCDLRDEIIPRAVSYFLGEVDNQDWSDSDGGSDDISDDNDDDDDDKGDSDEEQQTKPTNTQQSTDECKTQ